ncbi:hypothetical protein ES703_114037 [subsurface metagenome]
MRIEEITEPKLKKAKGNELYSLKLRFLQVWQKLVRTNVIKK